MRPQLTENPWFWLMLFGSLGAVGVVVIGPKYAARLARMERMAETRERVNAAKELGISATEVRKVKPDESAGGSPAGTAAGSPSGSGPGSPDGSGAGSSAEKGPIEPYVEADFRSQPRLQWLLALMVLLMLAGTGGMIVSRRSMNLLRSRRAA
jgi:hypothetical protein